MSIENKKLKAHIEELERKEQQLESQNSVLINENRAMASRLNEQEKALDELKQLNEKSLEEFGLLNEELEEKTKLNEQLKEKIIQMSLKSSSHTKEVQPNPEIIQLQQLVTVLTEQLKSNQQTLENQTSQKQIALQDQQCDTDVDEVPVSDRNQDLEVV